MEKRETGGRRDSGIYENCIKDNRGVTLLEVIIAVTIFAIASVVLFKGFYSAGMMNKKSNTNMEATDAAQNIMEGVKGNSLEELALQFNYPWDIRKDICRFNVLPMLDGTPAEIKDKTIKVREVNSAGTQTTGSVTSDDEGTTYEFNENENGQYYFQIQNFQSGSARYDATVTVDGLNAYTNDDGSGKDYTYKDSNPASGKPNNYAAPNLADLNVYEDAFLVVGDYTTAGSMDDIAFRHMIENYKNRGVGAEADKAFAAKDVMAYTKRKLVAEVKTEYGSKKAIATYTLSIPAMQSGTGLEINGIDYLCTGNSESNHKHDGQGTCFCTSISENIFFDNSETGSPLRGMYLFYCPNYHSQDANNILDEITVINNENLELELYVVKQSPLSVDTAKLLADERNYRVSLKIMEKPKSGWNTLASRHRGATKLRTNLNTNLAYETVSEREKDKSAAKQMLLRYEDTAYGGSRYADNTTSTDKTAVYAITWMKNLQASESEFRIYSIKVNVYKAGTLSEKQADWKKNLIVSLDGSKDD